MKSSKCLGIGNADGAIAANGAISGTGYNDGGNYDYITIPRYLIVTIFLKKLIEISTVASVLLLLQVLYPQGNQMTGIIIINNVDSSDFIINIQLKGIAGLPCLLYTSDAADE